MRSMLFNNIQKLGRYTFLLAVFEDGDYCSNYSSCFNLKMSLDFFGIVYFTDSLNLQSKRLAKLNLLMFHLLASLRSLLKILVGQTLDFVPAVRLTDLIAACFSGLNWWCST